MSNVLSFSKLNIILLHLQVNERSATFKLEDYYYLSHELLHTETNEHLNAYVPNMQNKFDRMCIFAPGGV